MDGNPKDNQVVEIEDKEEDWLPPPPKVSVDAKDICGQDSTLKELRYSNLVVCIYCLFNTFIYQSGTLILSVHKLLWLVSRAILRSHFICNLH